jgi:hypothetical protein
LKPRMREFLNEKLKDNNPQYSADEMKRINRKMRLKVGLSVKVYKTARTVFYSLPDGVKIKLLKVTGRSKK